MRKQGKESESVNEHDIRSVGLRRDRKKKEGSRKESPNTVKKSRWHDDDLKKMKKSRFSIKPYLELSVWISKMEGGVNIFISIYTFKLFRLISILMRCQFYDYLYRYFMCFRDVIGESIENQLHTLLHT